MKKNLLIVLVVFLNSWHVKSQTSWAEPQATWFYTFDHFAYAQYVKIEKVGDTLINGINCDVLQKTRIGYDYSQSIFDTINLGREYTCISLDGDTVLNFRSNQFYVLYIFSALPGDTWILRGNNSNCALIDTIRVDSIGTTIINSDTLRYLWTSKVSNSLGWYFTGKIVEKIGCIGYMFPEPYCQIIDINEGGLFRCYDDSLSWSFSSGIVPTCDYTTSIGELKGDQNGITIFPNPFLNTAEIIIPKKFDEQKISFKVFNEYGEEILKDNNLASVRFIDGQNLSSGIYFWIAYYYDKKILSTGKFIKY